MARAKIADGIGMTAVRDALAEPGGPETATAVRWLLQTLAQRAEGNTVEVRVPPYGAVQCIPGPRHTRGTPPNVVETTAPVWLDLATGRMQWDAAIAAGLVTASGSRADLRGLLPLWKDPR